MNTKALIFDADGMIVHGERFSKRLARDFGISTDITTPFFVNEFQLCLVGKADLKQELAKHLKKWGWEKSIDDLLDVWFDESHTQIEAQFLPLIQNLRAKGVAVYLATNNEKYRTANLVEGRGLGKLVDGVFSSAHLGSKKPEADFFQRMIDEIGIDKRQIVFWDDDMENIDGAVAFGLPAELYTDFAKFQEKVAGLM